MNIKKFVILNTIITFILCFIFHFMYDLSDNFIFSILFPVNESIFEHTKLVFISSIVSNIILYKKYKFSFNNYIVSILVSYIVYIIIFNSIWLPLYLNNIESFIFTIIWLFVSIFISNITYYLLDKRFNNSDFNKISVVFLVIIFLINTYFTFNPVENFIFIDPETKSYGIP